MSGGLLKDVGGDGVKPLAGKLAGDGECWGMAGVVGQYRVRLQVHDLVDAMHRRFRRHRAFHHHHVAHHRHVGRCVAGGNVEEAGVVAFAFRWLQQARNQHEAFGLEFGDLLGVQHGDSASTPRNFLASAGPAPSSSCLKKARPRAAPVSSPRSRHKAKAASS